MNETGKTDKPITKVDNLNTALRNIDDVLEHMSTLCNKIAKIDSDKKAEQIPAIEGEGLSLAEIMNDAGNDLQDKYQTMHAKLNAIEELLF